VLVELRKRCTYSNVMATIAVFIAMGGTSYALTLQRDSVGSRELRARSVGSSELKTGGVGSRDIADRGVGLRDISLTARSSLRGARGPEGPRGPSGTTFFAGVDSGGGTVVGDVSQSTDRGLNGRLLHFARPVDACGYSATLARIPGGGVVDPEPGSTVTVAAEGGGVLVRTWDASNQPKALPFHLIVAC
jgi:hypothetical protein